MSSIDDGISFFLSNSHIIMSLHAELTLYQKCPFFLSIFAQSSVLPNINMVAQPFGRLALYGNLFYHFQSIHVLIQNIFLYTEYICQFYESNLLALSLTDVVSAFTVKVITDKFAVPLIIILETLHHLSINKWLFIHIYESVVRTLHIAQGISFRRMAREPTISPRAAKYLNANGSILRH